MFNNVNHTRFGKITKSLSLRQYQLFNGTDNTKKPDDLSFEFSDVYKKPETFKHDNPMIKIPEPIISNIDIENEMKLIEELKQFLKTSDINKKPIGKYARNI